MGGGDAPPVFGPHPGLHLPADPARRGVAIEQSCRDGAIVSVSCDLGLCEAARQTGRGAADAEGADRLDAVEIFRDAIADGGRLGQEQRVEGGDVVVTKAAS